MSRVLKTAMMAGLGLAIAACGLFGGDEDVAPSGGGPTVVEAAREHDQASEAAAALAACRANVGTTAAIVWLRVGAEPQEVAGLDELLDSLSPVASHRFVDEAETRAQFEAAYAEEPEILDLVEPDQLPTSFDLIIAAEADVAAVVAEIELAGVVDEIELAPDDSPCRAEVANLDAVCEPPTVGLFVWLEVGVEEATVADVAAALDASTVVADSRYFDQDDMWELLQGDFAGNDEALDLTDPSRLPTRFTVTLVAVDNTEQSAATELDALITTVEAFSGVDGVQRERRSPPQPCAEFGRSQP